MKRPSLAFLLPFALLSAGIALLIGRTSSFAYADMSASNTTSVSYAPLPDPNAIRTDIPTITWQNLAPAERTAQQQRAVINWQTADLKQRMAASAEIARAQKKLLTDIAALETLNKKLKSGHKLSGKKRTALRKQIAALQTKIAAERLAFEGLKMRQMMTPHTHLQMAMIDIRPISRPPRRIKTIS